MVYLTSAHYTVRDVGYQSLLSPVVVCSPIMPSKKDDDGDGIITRAKGEKIEAIILQWPRKRGRRLHRLMRDEGIIAAAAAPR